MKLGQFSITQQQDGSYIFSYANKNNEYDVFKAKLTEYELTNAIFDLIEKKTNLKHYCAKLYKELQLKPDNNYPLPNDILAIIKHCPELPNCSIFTFTEEQDLQLWIDGFNKAYNMSFDADDITPLLGQDK